MIDCAKRRPLVIAGLLYLAGALLYALYEAGVVGSHSLRSPFVFWQSNPYDGDWHYDIDRIDNSKILKSALTERKSNYSPLVLFIDGPNASLLGYQLNSSMKSRFFNVCLEQDRLQLTSGGFASHYCEAPPGSGYSLEFRSLPDGALYCENCSDYDFPSYWERTAAPVESPVP